MARRKTTKPEPPASDQRGCFQSRPDIAATFRVSVGTVARWLEDGMPGRQRGGYPIRAILQWLAKTGRLGKLLGLPARRGGPGRDNPPAADEADPISAARVRRQNAEARMAELKAAQAEGLLIERAKAEADRMAVIRCFLGLTERAGPELANLIAGIRHGKPAEVRKTVEDYFIRCLTELSK